MRRTRVVKLLIVTLRCLSSSAGLTVPYPRYFRKLCCSDLESCKPVFTAQTAHSSIINAIDGCGGIVGAYRTIVTTHPIEQLGNVTYTTRHTSIAFTKRLCLLYYMLSQAAAPPRLPRAAGMGR